MNHTPGPWRINDAVEFDSFISGPTGKFEDVICQSPRSHQEDCKTYRPWHDNKHLIAAAPEMLEALIEVYSAWRHTDNVTDPDADGYEILNKIKSIIERATGCKIEEVIK